MKVKFQKLQLLLLAAMIPILATGCSFSDVTSGIHSMITGVLFIIDIIIAAITGINTVTAFFSSTRGTNKITRMGRDSIGNGRQVISFIIAAVASAIFGALGLVVLHAAYIALPTVIVMGISMGAMFYSNFLNKNRVKDASSAGRDIAETVQPAVTTVAAVGGTAVAAVAGAPAATVAAVGAASGVAGAAVKRTMDKKLGKPKDTEDIDAHAKRLVETSAQATKQVIEEKARNKNNKTGSDAVIDVDAKDIIDVPEPVAIEDKSIEVSDEAIIVKAVSMGIAKDGATIDEAVKETLALATEHQLKRMPESFSDKEKAAKLLGVS